MSTGATVAGDRQQLRDWYDEEYGTLLGYACETLPDGGAALDHIWENLRKCRATTKEGFVIWATKKITKMSGFEYSYSAIEELDLDVLRILNQAAQAFDFKPFNAIKNGNALLIDMGEYDGETKIWKVPTNEAVTINGAEWTWAGLAEHLWPCHLRKVGEQYQVTKKLRGKPIHVARIYLAARDEQMLKFRSGDSLDYTGNNPYIVANRAQQNRFERRIMKNTGWNLENETGDPTDAKATAPRPMDGDERDMSVLRSGDYKSRGNKIVAAFKHGVKDGTLSPDELKFQTQEIDMDAEEAEEKAPVEAEE